MLSNFYNYTRPAYNFKPNEAYSCSMYLKNGFVSKLSFNIELTDDLIELF